MGDEHLTECAKAFVKTVATHAPKAEIEAYYAPDIMQEKFPNRLLPKAPFAISTHCAKQAVKAVRLRSSDPSLPINASPFRRFGPGRLQWASANSSQATDCVLASPSFSTLKTA